MSEGMTVKTIFLFPGPWMGIRYPNARVGVGKLEGECQRYLKLRTRHWIVRGRDTGQTCRTMDCPGRGTRQTYPTLNRPGRGINQTHRTLDRPGAGNREKAPGLLKQNLCKIEQVTFDKTNFANLFRVLALFWLVN